MKISAASLYWIAALMLSSTGVLSAQDQTAPAPSADPPPATAPAATESTPAAAQTPEPLKIDKRAYGVLPNYRTADGNAAYEPISAKRKITIGFKDSFDYPVYFTSAVFDGISTLLSRSPEFGHGIKGFAKLYVASYADQAIGNIMTEGLFPAAFHQDPRYFRVGPTYGGTGKRIGYALKSIVICRQDNGRMAFNISEWGGNASAVAISNAYYSDNRNVSDNVQKLGIQVGTDALSNILKEFWPDVKKRYFGKNKKASGD